jgi:hypothetical protein
MAGGARGSRANQRLDSAELEQKIVALRRQHKTYQDISDELEIPLATVYRHYRAVCARIPAPDLEMHRQEMLTQLDQAEQVVLEILHEIGLKVSASGRVVVHDGIPLKDRSAALDAARTLVSIQARKARLLGADSETKIKTEVQVNYRVQGVDTEALK